MSGARGLVESLVRTVPGLNIALNIRDCICLVLNSILGAISWIVIKCFSIIFSLVSRFFTFLLDNLPFLRPAPRGREARYERLKDGTARSKEPVPYRDEFIKRSITYHGGLILGFVLYLFVYYVLIKHHTYATVAVASLLLLAYLVVLENSHDIRSILMLCLPIMFTNRGRALVYCCMIAIMITGPLKNAQENVNELHLSLNCCKQYLIVKADKYVDENIVQNLVRVEDVVRKLVDQIKEFADEIKEKFRIIIQMAIMVERYIQVAIEKMKEIVNICNAHTKDAYDSCYNTLDYAYEDCRTKLGSNFDFLCKIVKPLTSLCQFVQLPNVLCEIPQTVVRFIDQTIGERLRYYMQVIENEFYVEIEVEHKYIYNVTKGKEYERVLGDIRRDVANKFWYIRLFGRLFNLVSLILVVWILITATKYHMHYLEDEKHDNIYIDGYLYEIDDRRRRESVPEIDERDSSSSDQSPPKKAVVSSDGQSARKSRKYLFPMPREQLKLYSPPFTLAINEEEGHKLWISTLVWLIIMGYIFFFVLLDYSLYQLIELVRNILNQVLFSGDLPLVDVQSKVSNQVVRYNRTQLAQLRAERLRLRNATMAIPSQKISSLNAMYRRLVDSIEQNIPDDVTILDSLSQCLPSTYEPSFDTYRRLMYLALVTFGFVIVETYAIRTRHCVANLYYPVRAKRRAVYLYRKLLEEKIRYERTGEIAREEDEKYRKLAKVLKLAIEKKPVKK